MKRILLPLIALIGLSGIAYAQGPAADTAATASPAAVVKVDHPSLVRLHWQLVTQAATFRQMTCFEMIDTLHAQGIHHIELADGQPLSKERPGVTIGPGMSAADIEALMTKLQAVHMDIVSYGTVAFDENEVEARNVFGFGKKLKLKNIVAAPTAKSLEMLDRLAAQFGINVAIVNSPKSPYSDPDVLLKAIAGRSDRIGVCPDLANWRRAGLVPIDCLKKLSGHIIEVRFSDVDAQNKEVPLGSGTVDAESALKWLKDQDVRGAYTIQYLTGDQTQRFNNWVASVNFFAGVAKEVAPPPAVPAAAPEQK